jgi:hypothetical protein
MKRFIASSLLAVSTLCLTSIATLGPTQAGAAPSVRPHTGSLCPGAEQMTIVNNSGYPDDQVYGAVSWNSGPVGTVTPTGIVNQSLPLQGNYPATGAPHTYYFCLQSGAGRFWMSLGSAITSDFADNVQPDPATAPYRFGIVEFDYPSSAASLDTSNVNNFDFPVNLQTYATPGDSTAAQSAVFSGNTCQVVNAMRTAVANSGGAATMSQVELDSGGQFVRLIAPATQTTGWPDMSAYISSLAASLPLVTSGPFTGDRGPLVINDNYGGDPDTSANQGWFNAEGFFDPSDNLTIAAGNQIAGLGAGGSSPGGPYPIAIPDEITVSEAQLATGIYQQGFTYGQGDGNDIYAWMWGDLTAGFDYGYWGSAYGNDSLNFSSPPGADALSGNGLAAFTPQRTVAYPSAPGSLGYNLYASVLSQYSPSYAFPYNERWGRGGFGTSPLLNMPTGGEVRMTVPADGWSGGSGSSTCAAGGAGSGTGPGGRPGYREVASDGGIFNFGGAAFFGSMGGQPLNAPIVGMADTPSGNGYWEEGSDGGIFSFGDASFHGSMGGKPLNAPIAGIGVSPSGQGYWQVATDGGIFSFGDASFFGSMGGKPLNAPIVGIAPTADGGGYWEVASDGGIFSFGDASFYGSMGGQRLNQPIVGMASAPDGLGYWLVARDGGIFAFGSATFQGSMGGRPLNQPVVGLAPSSDGQGYWEVAADGGMFNFGNAQFFGSMGGQPLNKPIVGMA